MEMRYGSPFRGDELEQMKQFLREQGLRYESVPEFSVCAVEDARIAASGSLDGNVLKYIAVSQARQQDGLAARILSELISAAARKGRHHLFIFTKPEKAELFSHLGFFPVAQTEKAMLMENKKNGAVQFAESLRKPEGTGVIGAVVANCNPFTRGHLYLIETAAARCRTVHLFILSENKSGFPPEIRRELAVQGTAHIPNVIVQPTGQYIISAATFPEYFIKDSDPAAVNAELDLKIFAEVFARGLGITRRFVGTEPYSPITAAYNRQMREILPRYGVDVVEIPRLESGSAPISASRVRGLLREGRIAEIEPLTPPAVFRHLAEYAGT
jgi:[citrate (pro-3S)-lyase] ligase